MMHDCKVSALPVLEGEGRVVGVVSEADLLPKEEFRDSDPDPPGDPHHPAAPAVRPREGRRGDHGAREVRREVVSYLFPTPASSARVSVRDGVVTLSGHIRDASLVPVAARLIRAVEGVVDVEFPSSHTEDASPS